MRSSPPSRRSRTSSSPRSTRCRTGAAAASILGVVGLVWTVSQLYGALDVAFARIFADVPERDIVRRTARGLLVVGLLVVIIVALVVAGALATAFDSATRAADPAGRARSQRSACRSRS